MPALSPRTLLSTVLAAVLGLGLGLACKSGGGSRSPGGTVTAIEGPASCPRQVPSKGDACPRGESEFCVYRTTGGDFACVCGGGKWGCGAK